MKPHPTSTLRTRPRAGFTLIEMLVVVAIALALMAMIVPGAGSIKKKAQYLTCMTNLAAQANAFNIAVSEDDGTLPLYRVAGGSFRIYYDYIDEFMENEDSLLCPVMDPGGPPSGWWGGRFSNWKFVTQGNVQYGSYCFNAWMHDSIMVYDHTGSRTHFFGKKLSSVPHPSKTPLASDGYWVDAWPRKTNPVPPNGDEANRFSNNTSFYRRIFTDRHFDDKQNFSFADGHASSVDHSDIAQLYWNNTYP